jgi:hypothetical protein
VEFYKIFLRKIGPIVCDAIKYASEHGMSKDQKIAILRLLPKGEKDTKVIPFLRPISLLNTQYKIYAKVLSNRLEPTMANLINPAQNAYIKTRNISHNIRNTADMIEYAK